VPIATAAMEAGADALTIANTWIGLAIDTEARRPVFAQGVAGVSGPAIRPLTLRHVWQVARALPGVPIIGLGGIMTGRDAVEYLLAGATAVGVGTASMVDPAAGDRIARELDEWCAAHSVADVNTLVGAAAAP
jgi:dihydroorotate dehydrogenase (NAD+) catalytic subunit